MSRLGKHGTNKPFLFKKHFHKNIKHLERLCGIITGGRFGSHDLTFVSLLSIVSDSEQPEA